MQAQITRAQAAVVAQLAAAQRRFLIALAVVCAVVAVVAAGFHDPGQYRASGYPILTGIMVWHAAQLQSGWLRTAFSRVASYPVPAGMLRRPRTHLARFARVCATSPGLALGEDSR